MENTKSFPPADALISYLRQVDYQKLYNTFMDFVVVFCAAIAAVFTVLRTKWVEYDCTERVQLAAIYTKETTIKIYTWVREVFIPLMIEVVNDIRSFYNVLKVAQQPA